MPIDKLGYDLFSQIDAEKLENPSFNLASSFIYIYICVCVCVY